MKHKRSAVQTNVIYTQIGDTWTIEMPLSIGRYKVAAKIVIRTEPVDPETSSLNGVKNGTMHGIRGAISIESIPIGPDPEALEPLVYIPDDVTTEGDRIVIWGHLFEKKELFLENNQQLNEHPLTRAPILPVETQETDPTVLRDRYYYHKKVARQQHWKSTLASCYSNAAYLMILGATIAGAHCFNKIDTGEWEFQEDTSLSNAMVAVAGGLAGFALGACAFMPTATDYSCHAQQLQARAKHNSRCSQDILDRHPNLLTPDSADLESGHAQAAPIEASDQIEQDLLDFGFEIPNDVTAKLAESIKALIRPQHPRPAEDPSTENPPTAPCLLHRFVWSETDNRMALVPISRIHG